MVTLTCIAVPSLLSVKMTLKVQGDEITIDETKEKTELGILIGMLLKQRNFIHLCFHADNTLLYDLFVMNQNLLQSRKIENETVLVSYYFKRFLLLDSQDCAQSTI